MLTGTQGFFFVVFLFILCSLGCSLHSTAQLWPQEIIWQLSLTEFSLTFRAFGEAVPCNIQHKVFQSMKKNKKIMNVHLAVWLFAPTGTASSASMLFWQCCWAAKHGISFANCQVCNSFLRRCYKICMRWKILLVSFDSLIIWTCNSNFSPSTVTG